MDYDTAGTQQDKKRIKENVMQTSWAALWMRVQARIELLRRNPEAGYSTETVLVTAVLVIATLAIIAIIVAKVTAKANGINLGL
jgi:hypothetical protein